MKSKWNNKEANSFIKKFRNKKVDKDLALRIYTTQLLGNDPKVVLHGGGNTSVKSKFKTLLGNSTKIIYVKGSGKDMSNIEEDGFPSLELNNLLELEKLSKLNDFQMVNYQRKYMLDTSFPNASVETLLHAFLPHKYVDHSHSTAILSIIDQPNPVNICKKVFGDEVGIVPYIMPGFELAKKASEVFNKNKKVKGLILLNHGIFTFAEDAKTSYELMIKYISKAENELNKNKKSLKIKKYNTTLWISLPDQPGRLGEVTSMIGENQVNISSVEMTEKTDKSINFRFNLIIHDLKNFTKLISQLKQKEYNFKIIRHKNKKYAFFKRLFGGFKKN